jgi:hypothetical protein
MDCPAFGSHHTHLEKHVHFLFPCIVRFIFNVILKIWLSDTYTSILADLSLICNSVRVIDPEWWQIKSHTLNTSNSLIFQAFTYIFVIGQDWGKKPHNHNVEKYFDEHAINQRYLLYIQP